MTSSFFGRHFAVCSILALSLVPFLSAAGVQCGAQDACDSEDAALLQRSFLKGGSIQTHQAHQASLNADSAEALLTLREAGCREWEQGRGNKSLTEHYQKNCALSPTKIGMPCSYYIDLCQYCKVTGNNCDACALRCDIDRPVGGYPGGCKAYCDTFTATCQGVSNPVNRYYKSWNDCIDKCVKIPETDYRIKVGNTLACRSFHYALSQGTTSETAFHCNHAFYEDPMYICRNTDLEGFNKDLRVVVYEASYGKTAYQGCRISSNRKVVNCQNVLLSDDGLEALIQQLEDEGIEDKVEVLDLSVNSLTNVPEIINKLVNLKGLAVTNNLLTSIHEKAFQGLDKLSSLLLDFNAGLATLPSNLFADTSSLVEFSITSCGLTGIPETLFANTPNLRILALYANIPLGPLPANLFNNTPNLFLLSVVITGTQLSGLNSTWDPSLLLPLINLEHLHIALNGPPCNYAAVPTGIQDGLKVMKNLKDFVLWGCNKLETLPAGLFSANPELELAWFFKSGITSFPEDLFANQHNMQIAALDDSNISIDCSQAASRYSPLYDVSNGDQPSQVCDNPCVGVCPMVRTLKRNNPGVFVTFGNWLPQVEDALLQIDAKKEPVKLIEADSASFYAIMEIKDSACRSMELEGSTSKVEYKKNCAGRAQIQITDSQSSMYSRRRRDSRRRSRVSRPNDPQWPGGCPEYCDLFMSQCSAPSNPVGRYYSSAEDCLAKCMKIPVTDPTIQQGNTAACRAFHYALSQSTTSQVMFHCNHAYYKDPMYICRNAELSGWNKDIREIIYEANYVPGQGVCDGTLCKCTKSGKVVNCQGNYTGGQISQSQFENIIKNLPANVEVLDLSVNSISNLTAKAFSPYTKLKGLAISNNAITTIDEFAFQGLECLESLLLDFNQIASIPAGTFADQKAMTEFSISNNILDSVHEDLFSNTKKLKFLTLFGQIDGNGEYLSTLPVKLFRNTPDLFLLSMVVTATQTNGPKDWGGQTLGGADEYPIGLFDGVNNLEQLHIALNGPNCEYQSIPQEVQFALKHNKKLRCFVMWGCPRLTNLRDDLFANNPDLDCAFFFQSGITAFPKDLFANQRHLQLAGLDSANIDTSCALAARDAEFQSVDDNVGYVCNQLCGALCPMVRVAKTNNPGVKMTFGNYQPQSAINANNTNTIPGL